MGLPGRAGRVVAARTFPPLYGDWRASMTTEEKQALRRILIAGWELLKSESKTEAIKHIDEIVDACDKMDNIKPKEKTR